MDENALAKACAMALFQRDPASQMLAMEIGDIAPGQATVTMRVRADMVNGHGSCHGGFIFTLADSAFAFASNSRNQVNVALSCSIDYLAPAAMNDTLTAVAQEYHRSARTGLFEISVRNQNAVEIARFRGRAYQMRDTVLTTAEEPS